MQSALRLFRRLGDEFFVLDVLGLEQPNQGVPEQRN